MGRSPIGTSLTSTTAVSRRLPRALAVALIYLTAIGLILGAAWLVLGTLLPLVDPLLARYLQQTALLRGFLDPFRRGGIAGGAVNVVQGVRE